MKFETNYPYVLIHGMFGFGADEKIYDILPYWGMMTGNICTYLEGEGFETYAPSISPISGAWDRACEIYAQLVGGTLITEKHIQKNMGIKGMDEPTRTAFWVGQRQKLIYRS